MITKLAGQLRREIEIDGVAHVVTISPRRFLLTVKGRRKGLEIAWSDLVSGDAALTTALNASLTANLGASATGVQPTSPKPPPKRPAGKAKSPAPPRPEAKKAPAPPAGPKAGRKR